MSWFTDLFRRVISPSLLQETFINAFLDTIEEEILERARNKMILEHVIISMGMTDKEYTDKVEEAKESSRNGPSSAELSAILKVKKDICSPFTVN